MMKYSALALALMVGDVSYTSEQAYDEDSSFTQAPSNLESGWAWQLNQARACDWQNSCEDYGNGTSYGRAPEPDPWGGADDPWNGNDDPWDGYDDGADGGNDGGGNDQAEAIAYSMCILQANSGYDPCVASETAQINTEAHLCFAAAGGIALGNSFWFGIGGIVVAFSCAELEDLDLLRVPAVCASRRDQARNDCG